MPKITPIKFVSPSVLGVNECSFIYDPGDFCLKFSFLIKICKTRTIKLCRGNFWDDKQKVRKDLHFQESAKKDN